MQVEEGEAAPVASLGPQEILGGGASRKEIKNKRKKDREGQLYTPKDKRKDQDERFLSLSAFTNSGRLF